MANAANNVAQHPFSASGEHGSQVRQKTFFHFWRCFWLSFLVISLAYAGYCFYVPPNKIAWAEGYDVAQRKALQTGKPMILSFTGQWCVPCRIMKRQVWADPQVMAEVNEQFVAVAIEIDDPKNAALLERYNVKGAPVTIIVDSEGEAQRWRSGGTGKTEFLKFLHEDASANSNHS
ncbi:MAG: thioredoxin family protein [Planctomycetota bacterium]